MLRLIKQATLPILGRPQYGIDKIALKDRPLLLKFFLGPARVDAPLEMLPKGGDNCRTGVL